MSQPSGPRSCEVDVQPPSLRLRSDSLLSKWGFNDGDTPDFLMDYWDVMGIEYPDEDWHITLRKLVRAYLLPELEKHHTLVVIDMITLHNPIRAELVDGIEPDWYQDNKITLTPEYVDVPYSAIAEALGI